MDERSDCEVYATSDGYQCGNCGYIHGEMPLNYCTCCGAYVVEIVDEGDPLECEVCGEVDDVQHDVPET